MLTGMRGTLRAMDRTDLLTTMADGRAALRITLAPLTNAEMEVPVNGAWSRRDVLAHLEAWERRVAALFETLRSGADPGAVSDGEETDVLNARFFEEGRHRTLADVRRGEEDAYQSLARLVEDAPEDDLFDPERFAWTEGRPFCDWILGNTAEHYAEHLDQLAPPMPALRSLRAG
jgi:hypothetical protein